MQRSRRTNPYPFAWEIPLAAVTAIAFICLISVHTARSLANLLAGNGWAFTDRAHLFTSLPGILTGHAATALPGITTPASPRLLWTSIAITQTLCLLLTALATRSALRQWGPSRLRGMATAAQAEALLGRTRLHRHAPIIRPDLHPSHTRPRHDRPHHNAHPHPARTHDSHAQEATP